MHNNRVTFRISGQLMAQVEELAAQRGVSESEVMRDAVEKAVRTTDEQDTCHDRARRLGIVGSAKRLPRDLSTSKKHFKGFAK